MNIPIPTTTKVEAALKKVAIKGLWALPALAVLALHNELVEFLQRMPLQSLSRLSGWLVLATVVVSSLSLFYFVRYRIVEKALLKVWPRYYDDLQFDASFNEAAKKSEDEKKNP